MATNGGRHSAAPTRQDAPFALTEAVRRPNTRLLLFAGEVPGPNLCREVPYRAATEVPGRLSVTTSRRGRAQVSSTAFVTFCSKSA